MPQTVQQLAQLVDGKVHGDGCQLIHAAKPVSDAGAGEITFIENERYARTVSSCQASAIVVPTALTVQSPHLLANLPSKTSVIQVVDAMAAFVTIARHLRGDDIPPVHAVDPRAAVHPTAQIGPDTSIQAFAVIGEGAIVGARCRIHAGAVIGRHCRLGDDVTLFPHVVLYDRVVLGHRVMLHANAVIGADGFGFRLQDGRHVKVPQMGYVEIGDDVEIGACTTIDRGTFRPTRIGEGTKVDNLVMIGHNCQIGRHNLIVSQVGIAGSCTTGDYVVIAGQVGVADNLKIGDRAVIGAKAGVHHDIASGERILGAPGRPENEAKRILLSMDHLPEMRRELRSIRQHLGLDKPERATG